MPEYLKIGINTVLRIDTQSPFSKEDQQALSLSAMLSWSNGWVLNTLDYIPGKVHNRRRESMKTSWGINDRDSALEVLNWLSTEGHRSTWNETLVNFFEPSEFISNYANNLLYSEIALKDLGIIDTWEDVCKIDIDAWDWGRLVFLARYCYLDDYITEDEF